MAHEELMTKEKVHKETTANANADIDTITDMSTDAKIDTDTDTDNDTDTGTCCARTTHRGEAEKKALISRCNRVEGQIRGVRGMLEKDAYCDDVLNQIQAARAALEAISRLVLERHMKSCLIDRVRAGEDEVVDELLVTLTKLMR